MVSPVRRAQLGLAAACLVFVASLGVLGGKAIGRQRQSLGRAPDFVLRDIDGKSVSLSDLRGKIVVMIFASVRGPTYNLYAERLVKFADQTMGTGRVQVLMVETAIDENDPHGLNAIRVSRSITGQTFPTLLDPDCRVARSFGVERSMTVCVLDEKGLVRYRGGFDDNRDPRQVTTPYCPQAVASLLSRQPVPTIFTQAFGRPLGQPK